MSLSTFARNFSNSYQEIFLKRIVGRKIANFRLQAGMTFGQSVDRAIIDVSAVRVRNVTKLSDRTVDTISDSRETLTVDQIKGTTFALSQYEKIQAGPLNPGSYAGGKIAEKLALYLDGAILYEVTAMTYDFDNGDLTTLSSSGTAITLSSTTVPQMVARMPAKNSQKNNQSNDNAIFVIDSYAASDIAQYVMGKNIDLAGSTFANGYAGTIGQATVYVSEKLTSQAVITGTGTFSNTETIVINGVTLTAVSSIGSTAGNFLIGADLAASLTNLAALINDPTTTNSTQVALSAANQTLFLDDLRLAATATATTVSLVGTGSGRLTITETAANASVTSNFIHCYYGKPGFTDVVIQEEVDMEMRDEPKQRTTNIMCDKFYGIKTFADGKVKGLDVLINA